MTAKILSHPPLGLDTVIAKHDDSVNFSVRIEAPEINDQWQVQLWHSKELHHWGEVDLHRCRGGNEPLSVTDADSSRHHCWYSGSLPRRPDSSTVVAFTLRFRFRSQDAWKWAADVDQIGDGRLLFQPKDSILRDSLGTYLGGTNPNVDIQKIPSEAPWARLWQLTGRVCAATKPSRSGWSHYVLGLPTNTVRWFALVRASTSWLAPRHGKTTPLAEKDALAYSFLRTDGLHVVVLAVSGRNQVTTVLQGGQDKIVLEARNDQEEEFDAAALVSVGESFDLALAAVMYQARKLMSPYGSMVVEKGVQSGLDATMHGASLRPEWQQEWYDGLAYCTWNSLGMDLSEERISKVLSEFGKNGIDISNLIIDDGWQSTDYIDESQSRRGWTEFEANTTAFPEGLKKAAWALRLKHPSLNEIAVWHALLGYWGGISPMGRIAQTYGRIRAPTNGDAMIERPNIDVVGPDEASHLYEDFYSFLLDAGITSVKTDVQSTLDELMVPSHRRSLTSAYLSAWSTAHLRHFSGHATSCMSQTPHILFSQQLPSTTGPPIPARNSDDFFPDVDEAQGWHVFCNAHNALLTKHLNIIPDWDMFQTAHAWGWFHAAARAVSGGPVSVTDEPGKHDFEVARSLTARTPTGRTVLLRPSVVGRSVDVYTPFDERSICKVGAYHGGSGKAGASFMGVFNCCRSSASGAVRLKDFLGCGEESWPNYIIRSFRSSKTSPVMNSHEGDAVVAVDLQDRGWDVLTATPVHKLEASPGSGSTVVSNLGLLGKLTGAAAILSTHTELAESSQRVRMQATLKALGDWGVWVRRSCVSSAEATTNKRKRIDVDRDLMVFLAGDPVPRSCVSVDGEGKGESAGGEVVSVDVEGAWREMGLGERYSNEVGVEMFVRAAADDEDGVEDGDAVDGEGEMGDSDEDWEKV